MLPDGASTYAIEAATNVCRRLVVITIGARS
jgi:hypothetical protein